MAMYPLRVDLILINKHPQFSEFKGKLIFEIEEKQREFTWLLQQTEENYHLAFTEEDKNIFIFSEKLSKSEFENLSPIVKILSFFRGTIHDFTMRSGQRNYMGIPFDKEIIEALFVKEKVAS